MSAPEHKPTPTERLYEMAMAAITKPAGTVRGAESMELAQVHMGPQAGRWYCKNLATVAQEGETTMELWSRTVDAALKIHDDVGRMNDGPPGRDQLHKQLEATVAEAKRRGKKEPK